MLVNKFTITITIFAMMLCLIFIQWQWIGLLKIDNHNLESQLWDLKVESGSEQLRFQDAQKKAKIQIQQSQFQIKQILTAKVPQDCNDVMKWAVNESRIFEENIQ